MELSVFVVDDDESTRRLLSRFLDERGYQVASFGRGEDLIQLIEDYEYPLAVLIDIEMPHMNGMEVLVRIDHIQKNNSKRFIIPIGMSGKHTDSKDIVEVKKAGAKDFLLKPIVPEELFAILDSATKALQRARERQEELLKDDLTGFYRKKQGIERLDEEIDRSKRYGRHVGFVFIDLDYFKNVNDTYGHQVGDELLRLVSERIREVIRTYDIAIRYGGDELAVIFPDTGESESEKEAKRIWKHLSRHGFLIQGLEIKITVSIGVAVGSSMAAQELIRRADVALYRAKKQGRNRVCTFSEDEPESIHIPKKKGVPSA